MPPAGGKRTSIDASTIARVISGGVRGLVRGASEAWFGPQQPLLPVAQEVEGRQLDYPIGWNQQRVPRSESTETGISFAEMRALADGCDILRLVIETRKDQMASQPWAIKGRDDSDGGQKARDIEAALRRPDGRRLYSRWQRMLLEEMFVTDAACIYKQPGKKGVLTPQLMDGTLLKILMRPDGRLPEDPDPAFQQQLHGVPAVDYLSSEIIYAMRNPRVSRIYGFSPVEQIAMTVNIALRRTVNQLEYYTAGSMPDGIATVPEKWSPTQVKFFQDTWDDLLSGNTAERRRLRFIPGDTRITELKPNALKDEFDEWLARIVCYAMSVPPSPFIKQMNRATADTAQETAKEEGLEPIKRWWAEDVMDVVLAECFSAPELMFTWPDEEVVDPLVKAQIAQLSLGGPGKGWRTPDEVRDSEGRPPFTTEQQELMNPAPPPPPEPGDKPDPNSPTKVSKARRSLPAAQPRPPHRL